VRRNRLPAIEAVLDGHRLQLSAPPQAPPRMMRAETVMRSRTECAGRDGRLPAPKRLGGRGGQEKGGGGVQMAASAETRIAEMAVEFSLTDSTALIPWLAMITGRPVERMSEGDEWRTSGPDGATIGLHRLDPIAVAVQVCTAIAGMYWPFVFPHVLKQTNRIWREKRMASRDAQAG